MSDTTQTKLGLALGSGGVKGVAHLGVIRCLLANGVSISYLSGSSMGALVGALFAYTGDIVAVEDLFESLNNLRQGAKLVDISTRTGMLKGAKIEAFLDSYMHGARFEDLRLPLAVVATDLNTGEPVLLNSGPVSKAVRASISATPVIQPVEYGGRMLCDGGLSNPVPAAVLRAMGAEHVVAVSLNNGYFERRLDSTDPPGSIGKRGVAIMLYNLSVHATESADVVIEPAIDNQSILGLEGVLDRQMLHKNIQAGFDAAQVQIGAVIRLGGHCKD
jgi:NTE family protein